jgi:replicative DNA helicase
VADVSTEGVYSRGRAATAPGAYFDGPPPEDPYGGGGARTYERTPPQDLAAEQSVLGGMLMSKDAIADVVEVLKSGDFYKPAHGIIFDAVCDKYANGEPADAVTIAAALADSGDLGKIGGGPYLHDLLDAVPTAANAGYYAKIVKDKAILRRLIEAGTKVVQFGYGGGQGGRDIDDLVDLAQQAVYDVTDRRQSEDFAILSDLLQPTLDEIESLGANQGLVTGVPTGFADLDRLLSGLQAGQLIIVAGRPGLGKSTAAMDFMRHAALHHRHAAALFSLEMSKVEIVMRLLSAETRVPMHILRSGDLSDDDWTRLARRMGEISEAPLFIDDTASMTMMEIRAKARRLKQRHDLKLMVVDYLQLMSSPKKVESRQQEVSEISRGLKLLAKEVECPVIAVAQLNRGPEQRTDKRPQLSDLRESGCLTASTRLLRADTGAEITLGELVSSGAEDIPVWAADETLRLAPHTLTHAFPSGRKETFRMTLTSGKTIEATANHRFLTVDGWVELRDLAPGSRIAAPRQVPEPLKAEEWPEAEIVLLAHMIGDGSMVKRQPIRYASVDEANLAAVTEAAKHFGVTGVRDEYAAARVTTLRLPAPYRLTHGKRNPIAAWLDNLGLFDKRSHEKFVPDAVFGLPDDQVALFLRHLWATDGSVRWDKKQIAQIYYSSTSRTLAQQIVMLLMRHEIRSTIVETRKGDYRPSFNVCIYDGEDQLRFLRRVGVHGDRGESAAECLAKLVLKKRRTKQDTLPVEVWPQVRRRMVEQNVTLAALCRAINISYRGSDMWNRGPSRPRLEAIAKVLEDEELELLATNDIFWDKVKSIESIGEHDVYDATVLGVHNFIANGVVSHNSLEQDADVVILLHRDDYYDKESPRAGEADFIVAKHRNGATDTITVAAQLHLSRFVDMAV